MIYIHDTKGKVCANSITVEFDNDRIVSVKFHGGCDGNHKGIAKLAENMQIDEVIKRLSGITCGMRNTSCPDQLACALKEIINMKESK